MSEKRKRKVIIHTNVLIAAAVLFMVLTTIGMAVYAGGNDHSHSASGYSFNKNFFSDLGATRVYDKSLNVGSSVLFMLALTCIGFSIITFAFDHDAFESKGRLQGVGKASAVLALIGGAGFIGIAAVPWNVSGGLHLLLVQVAFGALLIYVILLITLQVANGWSRVFLALNVIYVLILAGYVVLLFFGPDPEASLKALETQVIGQKIIVYASIINIGLQGYGAQRYLRRRVGKAEASAVMNTPLAG